MPPQAADQQGQPRMPARLKARGRAFWTSTTASFELESDELEILTELCRALDLADEMARTVASQGMLTRGSMGQSVAHPLLGELRQTRTLIARLTAQLALPDEDGSAVPSGLSTRGRHAANKRWAGHTRVAVLDDARRHRGPA